MHWKQNLWSHNGYKMMLWVDTSRTACGRAQTHPSNLDQNALQMNYTWKIVWCIGPCLHCPVKHGILIRRDQPMLTVLMSLSLNLVRKGSASLGMSWRKGSCREHPNKETISQDFMHPALGISHRPARHQPFTFAHYQQNRSDDIYSSFHRHSLL